ASRKPTCFPLAQSSKTTFRFAIKSIFKPLAPGSVPVPAAEKSGSVPVEANEDLHQSFSDLLY
ncbi:MAG: hypothetical protein ACK449_08830, partial [Planctomycetota bacterium]